MKTNLATAKLSPADELAAQVITAQIHKLHSTQLRLQELTGGEVDAVMHPGGHAYLLHKAQQKLQKSEVVQRELAARQMAILNALPAHIALLDPEGVIISVNDSWKQFSMTNNFQAPEFGVGQNYLEICDRVTGDCSAEAHDSAAGIRSVLNGNTTNFSFEYPCHSPTEHRWFRLVATPMQEDHHAGAVIMHINITDAKKIEEQLLWKTAFFQAQVYSALDGILIVDRDRKSILQNQRLVDLWGVPDAFLIGGQCPLRLDLVTKQVKGSRQFTDKIEYLYDHPDEISRDEIELIDGKFLDRYSAPVRGQDGKYYGRIWTFRDITERKLAENRAEAQAELMNMAGRVGKLGAWAIEYPGAKIIWSEEVYRIHEAEPGFEPDLESALNFFPAASREKLAKAIALGQAYDLELEFITAKGRKRWVRTTSAMEARNGTLHRLYGIFQDVTERRESEESLKLFRTLVDRSPDAIEVIDPATARFLDVNETGWGRLGYTREELLAMTVSDISDDENHPAGWPAFVKDLKKTGSAVLQGGHVRKDGSTFPVEVNARFIDLNKGYVVAVVRDITERKRTEARLRLLVDSNVQGVIFWKTTGEITGANDAFLELTGYTREDLEAGRINWMALTPPEYAHIDRRCLEQIAATGVGAPYEKEYIRKDGTRVPIFLGAAAFEDNPNEGVCFVLDITERKKLENQFLRAQRMESIGTLAGGIAHDLNNILAPILMSIHILRETVVEAEAKNILETIEVSAKRGADIVRQVLSFARGIEGERIEIQTKHLLKDLEAIIKDTFPKDIRLQFSVPNNTWTILGDPTQAHQVLLNLCVNARDAMPNGGSLIIAVKNVVLDEQYAAMNMQAKAGRFVNINVTDSGMGMPPELLEKIFEPFFTTKEVGKGTGLGLSTAMAIIKSHDGFVNVYSEPGKGTTFKIYLPAMDTPSEAGKAQPGETTLPRGNGEMVLLVDDEPSMRTITGQTLQAFGYRVLTATDGADAVAVYLAHRNEVAVVLTDMMMPVMDGPAMIHALMRINPEIKIIATSGLNANGGLTKLSEVRIKHFLTKPYTAATLLKTLRTILVED